MQTLTPDINGEVGGTISLAILSVKHCKIKREARIHSEYIYSAAVLLKCSCVTFPALSHCVS